LSLREINILKKYIYTNLYIADTPTFF